MKADYSERAGKTLQSLPPDVRKVLFKQVRFLERDLRHPSVRAKKYDETQSLWQARVNKDWRFYFLIRDGIYYIVDIIPHPK
jgi:mRNA-degrading endonuclease RelE of RelBE toxin-antitoxin system